MDEVEYDDEGDWPAAPDGSGLSLAKTDPDAASATPSGWSSSSTAGGTPGDANAAGAADGPRLNEVSSGLAGEFRVELYNTFETGNPRLRFLALEGYTLASTGAVNEVYTFTSEVIESLGYLAVDGDTLGFQPAPGDLLFLADPGGDVIDAMKVADFPRARFEPGTGRWLFPNPETPGTANVFTLHDEIVINEIMYHHKSEVDPYRESGEEWIELYNRSGTNVDLAGWTLGEAVDFAFAPGVTIEAGEYLVVAADPVGLASNYPGIEVVGPFSRNLSDKTDLIRLLDATGNPADEVRYYDDCPWPKYADGYGASLELRDPRADNSKPEAWAASDEAAKSSWQYVSYTGTAFQVHNPRPWNELVLGMLDAGEVLLDDISVIEDPDGAALEFIQNGSFDGDTLGGEPYKWRIIGTHRHSRVVEDAGNKVLRLVATDTHDHDNNHAETTFANSEQVDDGRTYSISFRAKWLGGSDQLNARLYFIRLARTIRLAVPALNGTPGTVNSRYEANIGPTFSEFAHSPVVPDAGEPVTITVRAEDPDGIGSCTLRWAVDGGSWSSQPMSHQGDGIYQAAVPGKTAGTIVQFYVQAADELTATSTYPASGADSRALYQVQDGRASSGSLHNLRLIMLSGERDWMLQTENLMSNDRIGGTVIYNEREVYYDVRTRHRGSAHARPATERIGYNIGYNADRLFRGVHSSIAVDRSSFVPAQRRQDEIYVKHMFNRAGVPCMYDDLVHFMAPTTAHDGSALLLMARYGDVFLASQFDNGEEGTVFNYDLVYAPPSTIGGGPEDPKTPGVNTGGKDLSDLGDDKEAYRWFLEIKNNRRQDDYRGLIAFCKAMSLPQSQIEAKVREVMDVDEWMRKYALHNLCGISDTYTVNNQHNLRIYIPPGGGKAVALPWDMDFTFSLPVDYPLWGQADSNLKRVTELPANLRLYYGHLRDLIDTTFNTPYMTRWMQHYDSLLHQNFVGQLSRIQSRGDYVLGRLPAQVPFEVSTAGPLTVDSDTATIEGRGWIDVKDVYLAGYPEPLELEWTSTGSDVSTLFFWSAVVPLAPGENSLTLLAYGFQGELIAQHDLTIVSTTVARPLRDHLRVTELMYDPLGGSDYEFIELCNTGPDALDLSAVEISGGVSFSFAGSAVTDLLPGEYVVIAGDRQAFGSRYGTNGIAVAGEFAGNLSNGGEDLRIAGEWNALVLEFDYLTSVKTARFRNSSRKLNDPGGRPL